MSGTWWRSRLWLLALVVLMLPGSAAAQSAAAGQPAQRGPQSCAIGAFVMALYDLSPANGSFESDVWLWSLCPDQSLTPLQAMEYINANSAEPGLTDEIPNGDIVWSSRKLRGEWRHSWDLRSFPFDRHTLRITVEEGLKDATKFFYRADPDNSGYSREIRLPGWQITDFRLVPRTVTYPTTFGDPTLSAGSGSSFSRLDIEVDIQRQGLLSFLKMTAVIYIAALLTLLSFVFNARTPGVFNARMSILAGALFATVLNLPRVGSDLGNSDAPTLIDALHIVCMVLILTVAILSVRSNYRTLDGHDHADIWRWEHRNMLICATLFVAANAFLIWRAVQAG